MIRSEQLLKEAREQDHVCEFCYYEFFDDKAYPCSRCVCNQPTENLWRAKVEDEPQMELCRDCEDYAGNGMFCAKDYMVYDFSRSVCKAESQERGK